MGGLAKNTLIGVDMHIASKQLLKELSQVLETIFLLVTGDQQIIHTGEHKINSADNIINKPLESSVCILQVKWYRWEL